MQKAVRIYIPTALRVIYPEGLFQAFARKSFTNCMLSATFCWIQL